jgi:membrane-associated protease RseP (regulator of RpoE activity)
MRFKFPIGPRGTMLAGGVVLAVCVVIGVTYAQVRDNNPRIAPAPGAGGREGGIPRKFAQERDRDRQEGLEEGTPDVEAQPGFREALPRWRPPQGDWKLGVWAYNTESGVVVTRVAADSPAARHGLERGDRIVSVTGYQVGYVGDLLYPLGYELRRQADGRGEVLLLVQNVRDKELLNLTVQVDRPDRIRPLPRERE